MWKNLKLSENYVISYRKIGDHIVDVHGFGNMTNFDADRFQNFLDKFIEVQSIQLPYVEMRNFEDLNGVLPSKRTLLTQKTYFIENKEKRIGFVAYNASSAIGMILMSGQRQYKKINVTLSVQADYKAAVRKALEILGEYTPYRNKKSKLKNFKISSEDIEKVALSCGSFLWEENDLFDLDTLNLDASHPLYPIVENFAIVREELIHLENESFKKTEALKSEKLQTEKIVESLQSGIIIVDPVEDRIVDINRAACEILNGSKEKIIGRFFHNFIDDPSKNKDGYLITFDQEKIPVLRSSVKVRLNNKNYLLENFVDISEAKEHEEKLKKTLAHTKQLNNLTFNREKRIIEMKKEVNALLIELGRAPKYRSVIEVKKDRGLNGE
jgi:PAS domain-containing protein